MPSPSEMGVGGVFLVRFFFFGEGSRESKRERMSTYCTYLLGRGVCR